MAFTNTCSVARQRLSPHGGRPHNVASRNSKLSRQSLSIAASSRRCLQAADGSEPSGSASRGSRRGTGGRNSTANFSDEVESFSTTSSQLQLQEQEAQRLAAARAASGAPEPRMSRLYRRTILGSAQQFAARRSADADAVALPVR